MENNNTNKDTNEDLQTKVEVDYCGNIKDVFDYCFFVLSPKCSYEDISKQTENLHNKLTILRDQLKPTFFREMNKENKDLIAQNITPDKIQEFVQGLELEMNIRSAIERFKIEMQDMATKFDYSLEHNFVLIYDKITGKAELKLA